MNVPRGIKPAHYCADQRFQLIEPDDPRMMECQCTFVRDTEEAHRWAGWRAGVSIAYGWHLRVGGSRLLLDDYGRIAGVEVDYPPFESSLLRDAITQMPFIVEGYQELYHMAHFTGSTRIHFINHVAATLNARMRGPKGPKYGTVARR